MKLLGKEFKFNDFDVFHKGNMGNGSGLDADTLDTYHASDFRKTQSQYTTTTATTEGYYRVATIPINSQFKNTIFKVKAYTATGTVTESTVIINMAYYSANYTSQSSAITANTSHSFNSYTNAENGYVLLYCRLSFDSNYGYIDFYKYKATTATIEIEPLLESDWVWATGALTVNPVVGAYRNTSCVMYAGLSGSGITASSASYATYSNYGVLGTETISNTTNKTGQWAYFGNFYIAYNASYLNGHCGNVTVRVQELSSDGKTPINELDDFDLNLRVALDTHIDGSTFNSLVPTCAIEIDGKTSLKPTDFCALVHSTSTSTKYIRFYIKLKAPNTIYTISPIQRYGRSFNSSTAITTSFCYFNYAGQQATITALPTPAQGSYVYATIRTVDANTLDGKSASSFSPVDNPSFTGNVGIGVATPSEKLEVSGNVKVSGSITAGGQTVATVNQIPTKISQITNDSGFITSSGSISGNAGTATKLQTPRTINGVSFDGTANITIADSTKEPIITSGLTTQYWSGTKNWRDLAIDVRGVLLYGLSTATNAIITTSDTIITALGKLQKQISDNLSTLITHITNTYNPHGVTKSQIGLGNVDNTADSSKNVLSATKLTTARKINGVDFDGSSDITITANLSTHNHTISDVSNLQATLNSKASTDVATTTSNGLMSNIDKLKINSLGGLNSGGGTNSYTIGGVCTANGTSSFAQGEYCFSDGEYSHAEGEESASPGYASHAEGCASLASGFASHAEGCSTFASGEASHTEGFSSIAYGEHSHAEGNSTVVGHILIDTVQCTYNPTATCHELRFSHLDDYLLFKEYCYEIRADFYNADGLYVEKGVITGLKLWNYNDASKLLQLVETEDSYQSITTVYGLGGMHYGHAEGQESKAYGKASHAEGLRGKAFAYASHAEGCDGKAFGFASHAEGDDSTASGYSSHAEGVMTTASSDASHAEGRMTTASGDASHAEGMISVASGYVSHAQGSGAIASGDYSHASGKNTESKYVQTVIGQFNKISSAPTDAYVATNELFIIGNGTSVSARGNAFKVLGNGQTYAGGAYSSTGADYAEYFEWLDGNVEKEDRRGFFVTLDGDKIRKATSNDSYILGVVSVNPAIIGDNHDMDWKDKYLTNEWGEIIYEEVLIPEETRTNIIKAETIRKEKLDENGNSYKPRQFEEVVITPEREEIVVVSEAHVDIVPKLNPKWNPNEEYIPRSKRQEWVTIGMMGKLIVRDDGTCQINEYCRPNNEGIATICDGSSTVKFRVMKRISENRILILIK